jgi:hypothetical protein
VSERAGGGGERSGEMGGGERWEGRGVWVWWRGSITQRGAHTPRVCGVQHKAAPAVVALSHTRDGREPRCVA